jgi:hypothetical protein
MKGQWKQEVPLFHKESRRKKTSKRHSLKDNYWHLKNIDKSNKITFKTEVITSFDYSTPERTEIIETYFIWFKKRSNEYTIHPTDGYKVYKYLIKKDIAQKIGSDFVIIEDEIFKERVEEYQVISQELLDSKIKVIPGSNYSRKHTSSFNAILFGESIPDYKRYSNIVFKGKSKKWYQRYINKKDRTIERIWLQKQDFNIWINTDIDLRNVPEYQYEWEYDHNERDYILENETRTDMGINDIPTHEYSKSLAWLF